MGVERLGRHVHHEWQETLKESKELIGELAVGIKELVDNMRSGANVEQSQTDASSYNFIELSEVAKRDTINRLDKDGLLRRTILEEKDEDEFDMLEFDGEALQQEQVDDLRKRRADAAK